MMKKIWLFILGHQPDLALAELISVLKTQAFQYSSRRISRNLIVISSNDDFGDMQVLLNRLGGTIKIFELDKSIPLNKSQKPKEKIKEILNADEIKSLYIKTDKGRWTFGFSLFAPFLDKDTIYGLKKIMHEQGLVIKRYFASQERSTRFVALRGKAETLSSVLTRKNKLNTNVGLELAILINKDSVDRGFLCAVQDFEAYSERDYGRPARDPKTGSLPPKLAQILLNLAQVKPAARVHDPFVGIGTILQEGLLMGLEVSGSDSDPRQINASKKNLKWLCAGKNLKIPRLEVAAAESLKLPDESLDAFVTEGTLGLARHAYASFKEAEIDLMRINNMWLKVLQNLKPALKEGGKVVLVLPVLPLKDGQIAFTPLLDEIKNLGYSLDTLFPESLTESVKFSPRGTLIYKRPEQMVWREIIRLTKINGT